MYALGVILYELLCGLVPYAGDDLTVADLIRRGTPRLPIEIVPTVPEPLQAIAFKALERRPSDRYQSALDMAADLRLPVRPSGSRRVHLREHAWFARTIASRRNHGVAPARLLYPHEADRLRSPTRAGRTRGAGSSSRLIGLHADCAVPGRVLLSAVACSTLLRRAVRTRPRRASPVHRAGAAVHRAERRGHIICTAASTRPSPSHSISPRSCCSPLFLLILFHETHLLVAAAGDPRQLFGDGVVSNRQLQFTSLVACAWCGWLALRTRTAALSTVFTVLAFIFTLAVISDFGLRAAIVGRRWDRLAVRLFPLVVAYALGGASAEQTGRSWFSRPLYFGSAALFVCVLELFALDGRALRQLGGFSLAPWQSPTVTSPTLLDTVAVMTLNGAIFYAIGDRLVRFGSQQSQAAAQLLFALSPFALLHPLGYLVRTNVPLRADWLYAACATAIMLLSQRRQRRSFYYAGMLNLGIALFLIASHREWFERPGWAIAVIAAGLIALALGFALDRVERRRRP